MEGRRAPISVVFATKTKEEPAKKWGESACELSLPSANAMAGRCMSAHMKFNSRPARKFRSFMLHDVSYIELHRVTRRINDRFGQPGCQPIHLLATHHEHEQVNELFRAADVCVVTSLHDGMNLVCKEFIAARDDERGVLILSRFAGAARELPESLIVNPYHVEETADAMQAAGKARSDHHGHDWQDPADVPGPRGRRGR